MTEKELSEVEKENIIAKIPDLTELHDRIISFNPDFISMQFDHNSLVPVASICLKDCIDILYNARYALYWAHCHYFISNKHEIKINKMSEISLVKFYSDDVALRLYSAGEHLANSITNILNLSNNDIKPFLKRHTSNASVIGNYLKEKMPDNKITLAIKKLIQLPAWQETMNYRNKWVHDQPPQINGQGIIFKRGIRWETDGKEIRQGVKSRILHIGGSDEPDILVQDLLEYITDAFKSFVIVFDEVTDIYQDLLKKNGFSFNGRSLIMHLPRKNKNIN